MAMACKTVWSLEYASTHEQPNCKLSLWPLSQVTPLSSPSKHLKRLHRSMCIACKARETLVVQSEEAAPSSFPEDLQRSSLASRAQGASEGASAAAQGGYEEDKVGLSPSEEAITGGFSPELPFDLRVAALQGDGSLPAGSPSSFMQVAQKSAEVRLRENDVGLQVQEEEEEDEEEKWMKAFHGAKGALVKPLSSKKLAFFPEGYLETIKSIKRFDWVTVVPTGMLAKGDRLVLEHNGENVMLFWFEGRIYAIENRSPAAPMFTEAFAKAVISEDGLITCPVTQSKYYIKTGATMEWLPKISFLERLFTPRISDVTVYAVKASPDHIFIQTKPLLIGGYYPLAEFTGNRIWTGPNYEEPIIYDDLEFGFTEENELTNGRFAMLGFLTLLILEMTTGEGILKGSGILDFLYKFLPGFPLLRY